MNDQAHKVVGIDRKPYREQRFAKATSGRVEFRTFMTLLWRRTLIVLSVIAIIGHGVAIGLLVYGGSKGMGEALAAVLATCFLLGLARSAFDFFTRRPLTFHHYHHYVAEERREVMS